MAKTSRWVGWRARKPSLLRPFPSLRMEELESREVPATTFTWTGGGGGANPNWSNPANWGGTAPTGIATNQESLVFPNGVAQKTAVDDIANGAFSSILISGSNYSLQPASSAVTLTLGTPSGAYSVSVGAGAANNVLAINTILGGAANARQTFTMGASGGSLTITGSVSGTTGSILAMDGSGTLTLAGDNSGFTGQVVVDNDQGTGGILQITSTTALGSSTKNTVVSSGMGLQVALATPGTINEPLILNGFGAANDGALLLLSGNVTWAGTIELDSNTYLGAAAGAVLSITNTISDNAGGHDLSKEGAGEIQFNHANTYRGQTIIDNGILTIGDPQALGSADGTAATGTVVNSTIAGRGQLRLAAQNGNPGFTVLGELLTLNGWGPNGLGALSNAVGDNTWAGPANPAVGVILGSLASQTTATNAAIGAAAGTNLTISAIVASPNSPQGGGAYEFDKVDTGRLILNNANTYNGLTSVQAGILNVRDSQALGTNTSAADGTVVSSGATLELEVEAATGLGQTDANGRSLDNDSVTHDPNKLLFTEYLTINGMGFNNTGALLSVSGINEWRAPVTISAAGIGVNLDQRPGHPTPDSSYFLNDYSLTVTGNISGGYLIKRGLGQLILPVANSYGGTTSIQEGWVTIENANALGGSFTGNTTTPGTTVSAGAALHLRFDVANPQSVTESLSLSGFGPTLPYAFLNQAGALVNLGGNNTIAGDIVLNGQAGIGVAQINPASPVAPANPPSLLSSLTLTGSMKDGTTPGGIIKLGPGNLSVEGDGTYSGASVVQAGSLTVRNTTALGQASSGTATTQQTYTDTTTTVASGAVLQLGNGIASRNGGIAAGVQVWNEHLILNSPGQQIAVAGSDSNGTYRLTLNGGTPTAPIAISATAAQVAAALNALPNVVTAGGAVVTQTGPGLYTVVFGNAHSDDVPLMVVVPNSPTVGVEVTISGGNAPLVTMTDDTQQTVAVTSGVAGNTYRLGFAFNGKSNTTTAIDATASAATVQAALNALPSIQDAGGVTVTGPAGGPYAVVFINSQSPYLPLLTVVTGGTANAAVSGGHGNTAGDIAWRGAITLNAGTRIETAPDTRLTLFGPIDDATNTNAAGSDLVVRGADALSPTGHVGELALAGANTYRGTTWIDSGIVTALNSQAFGAGSTSAEAGGTVVAQGAQLQLQGSLTIAGEALEVQGTGITDPNSLPNFPVRWLNVGPAPTNNGNQTPTSNLGLPTSGRVTSVAVNPADANIIYIATAGGGVWKTKDGGKTWLPMFDDVSGADPNAVLFGGSLAIAPTNPNVIYFATGEANGVPNGTPNTGQQDNYAGTGVYVSHDAGVTWSLVQSPVTAPVGTPTNPLFGQAITKILVDPENSSRIYVASGNSNVLNADPNAIPGIWRFDPTNGWYNLTGGASPNRTNVAGNNFAAPQNAGPDDDYRIAFPQANATWSDILLLKRGTIPYPLPGGFQPANATPGSSEWVLYAALGESTQVYSNGTTTQAILNGVYRTENPDTAGLTSVNPTWWLGQGTIFPRASGNGPIYDPNNPGTFPTPTAPDKRGGGFPVGPVTPPNPYISPGRNGWIKLAGAVNTVTQPNAPFYGNTSNYYVYGRINAEITVYASIVQPTWNPQQYSELLDIQKSGWDGGIATNWTTIATQASFPTAPFGTATSVVVNGVTYNVRAGLGRYDNALIVQDPNPNSLADNNTNVIYLAGKDNLYKSTNGGVTWTAVTPDASGAAPASGYHALAWDNSSTTTPRLLTGSDGGIWRLNGAGTAFSNLNGNLSITQLNSADPNPIDLTQAIAGAQDNGTMIFGNSQAWTQTDTNAPTSANGFSSNTGVVRYDPKNPLTAYAVYDGSLRFTTDGGATWSQIINVTGGTIGAPGTPGQNYFPLVIDSVNSSRLLYGGGNLTEVLNASSGSRTFTSLSPGINVTAIGIATFQGTYAFDPRFPTVADKQSNTYDPDTIYVTNGSYIRVTKNHGTTWISTTLPGMMGGGKITDLAVDPSNRDTVYATVSYRDSVGGGRVYRSTDAGQTWTNISGDLPNLQTWRVIVDPRPSDAPPPAGINPSDTIYIGNDNGVWQLNNAATVGTFSWVRVGVGMPTVQVRDLVLNQQLNTLTAATYGRGMFQMILPNHVANSGALRQVSGSSAWTGSVTMTGDTTIGVEGTQAIQNGIAAASLDIRGVIDDNGGGYTLIKRGLGTLTLSGSNTYTGETDVTQGIVQANNASALGTAAGATIVSEGAALEIRSDLGAEPITLNGNGIDFLQADGTYSGLGGHFTGALRNVSGDNTYTGTLTLGTSTHTSAYVGAPTITIGVNSGSSLTLTGTVVDQNPATPAELDKELTGTLVLANNNSYAGQTVVRQGAIRVESANGLGSNTSLGTTVLDGAQLQISRNATTFAPTIVMNEPLRLSGTGIGGTGALLNLRGDPDPDPTKPNDNAWNGPITFAADPANNPISYPGSQVAIGVADSYIAGVRDTLTIGGVISQAPNESFGLIKTGPGILALNQANTYTGVTNINSGSIRVQNNGALGTSAPSNEVQVVTVNGSSGSFNLSFNGQTTATLSFSGSTPPSAGAVQTALQNLVTIGSGNVAVTATTGIGKVVYTVTFQGALGSQDVPLLTSTIMSGTPSISVATAQQGGLGTVVASGAALELDGTNGALTIPELLTLNGSGVNGAGALDNVAGSNTYAGLITMASNTAIGAEAGTQMTVQGGVQSPTPIPVPDVQLTKAGTGTVIFPTANAYGGQTVVNTGVLRISNSDALGTGRSEVQTVSVYGTNVFTLTFNGQTTGTLSNPSAADVQNALNALSSISGPETQTVDVGGTSGSFTLSFRGQTTPAINFSSGSPPSANDVQTALNALSTITAVSGVSVSSAIIPGGDTLYTIVFNGAGGNDDLPQILASASGGNATATAATVQDGVGGSVSVASQVVLGGTQYTITFGGTLANVNVAQITATPTNPAATTIVTGTTQDGIGAEVQRVTAITSNGSFNLSFNGQTTTAPLQFYSSTNGPSAGAVQAALNALPTIGKSEVQTLLVTGTSGTFTLTFTDQYGNAQTTGSLPFNATAAQVQTALNALSNLGGIGAGVTVTSVPVAGGTLYTISFGTLPGDSLANTDLPPLTVTPSGVNATVSTIQNGSSVHVLRSPVSGGFAYTVIFRGGLALTDQPQITASSPGSFASVATIQNGPLGTTVNAGATLQVDASTPFLTPVNELVTINGQGVNNQGALNLYAGNATWAVPLLLGSNASLGTTNAGDTLTLAAPISDGGNAYAVDTYGPGTINYASTGTAAYGGTVYTQYTGDTTAHDGTLLLSQPTGGAILGNLFVGDGTGAAGSAIVREMFDNQIADTSNVAVASDGLFDLNGHTDTIGTLTVTGGQVDTGANGNLTTLGITQTGGTITIGNGGQIAANGTITMTANAAVNAGNNATLTATGKLSADTSTIGFGTNGTFNVAGLTLTTASRLSFGDSGQATTGAINMSDGSANSILFGNSGTLTAGDVTDTGGTITFGDSGTFTAGKLDVANGSVGFGDNGTLKPTGDVNLSNATVSFHDGGDFEITGNLTGILQSAVTFLLNGMFKAVNVSLSGTSANPSSISLGDNPTFTATGPVKLDHSSVSLGANGLTTSAVGSLELTAGSLSIGSGTTVDLNGDISVPSTTATQSSITGAGTLALGGTDRTATVADGPDNVDLSISTNLTTTGAGLIKAGAGRLDLAPLGSNGFAGTVGVQAGDVQVDTQVGAVNLTGGSLSGTGTTGAITATSASPTTAGVSPGVSYATAIGTLTANGDVAWNAQTIYSVDLSNQSGTHPAPVAGSDYDRLAITGNLNLGGATLNGTFGTGIQLGDTFTIITFTGSLTGTFAQTNGQDAVFIGGQKFAIHYNAHDVTLEKIKANATIAVNSSDNPSMLNQPVTLTATVTPEAGATFLAGTTTVEFTIDTTTYTAISVPANGVVTLTLSPGNANALSGGTHTITAHFSGDPVNFNPADTPTPDLVQTVLVPAIDNLPAGPLYFSPQHGTGPHASLTISTTVHPELAATNWVVTILDGGNNVIRTITGSGTPGTGNAVAINAVWDGLENDGTTPAPEGSYTATVSFTDLYNNTDTTPSVTIIIDRTDPIATPLTNTNVLIAPGVTGVTVPGTTTLTSTVTDANFADWVVTVTTQGGTTVRTFTGTTPSVNVNWDGTDGSGQVVPDGAYILTLTAYDHAGNALAQSSDTVQTVVVLTHPPTITLMSNTPTVYGQSITLTATVSLPAGVPASITSLLNGNAVDFYNGTTRLGTGHLALVGGQYQATITVPTFNAGTYTSLQAQYVGTNNFLPGVSANATHVVTPAPLTVTANPATNVYGDPIPPLTYTFNAAQLVNGDTSAVFSGSPGTTATPASSVGTYAVTQGSVSAGSNYTIAFTNSTLTVTPAPLTITVNDASRAFGAANPPFTASFQGLKLNDTSAVVSLNLTTTATPNSAIGMYPITANPTPTATNYTITVIPGTLSVTPVPTQLAVGSGSSNRVNLYTPSAQLEHALRVFTEGSPGGVRTTMADFNHDGVQDLVVATGPGVPAHVQVIDGQTGQVIFDTFPFGDFTGGAFVAAGDLNGDGTPELVVTPDQGGGPRVVIYSGNNLSQTLSFYGINDPNFRGGVRPAVGDLNRDGYADLVIAAGFGGGPRISIWDGKMLSNSWFKNVIPDFYAFDPSLRNGTYPTVGDVNGDGYGDLIVGAGPGGGPAVKIFDGMSLMAGGVGGAKILDSFFAGDPNTRSGVRVAAKNMDGDLYTDVVTGDAETGRVIVYRGQALAVGVQEPEYTIDDMLGTAGGVYVG